MHTTLTLDDDIARRLVQLQQARGLTLDEVVNTVLRTGLEHLETRPPAQVPYRLTPVRLGPRLPDVDNIAEILAVIEGEGYR
jgi:hypothetical protein